ncbi:hypothetical protein [Chromobacterium haemolyticum]|uniref:hypothetical protein n=1 Tax=Chromobacterium TaxID=535 RepID=UPI004055E9D0
MAKQPKPRAKNLDDASIEAIVGILDGWDNKLTWELLIEAIELRLRVRYTRQALSQHTRIKQAFQLTKERIAGSPPHKDVAPKALSATETQALLERYNRLEAENARLKLENERLLEQFVVWAYNASTRGLDAAFLGKPLPRVDRDQTQLLRRAGGKSRG